MGSPKAEAKSMIEGLPEDASLEDIQYHLYVLEKVKRGIERAETGGTVSHEDAKLGSENGSRLSLVARGHRRHRIHRVLHRARFTLVCQGGRLKNCRDGGNDPEFQEIGRIVPEVGDPAIRERFAYSYRIIYRLEPQRVLIAAVIHGRRLLQPFVQRIEGAQKSNEQG